MLGRASINLMDKDKTIKQWFLRYSEFNVNDATYNRQQNVRRYNAANKDFQNGWWLFCPSVARIIRTRELGDLLQRPPIRVHGQNRNNNNKKNPVLKISKLGLIKVLLYSSKSQNFYGIILLPKKNSWFWKGKFNQNLPICFIKMFST